MITDRNSKPTKIRFVHGQAVEVAEHHNDLYEPDQNIDAQIRNSAASVQISEDERRFDLPATTVERVVEQVSEQISDLRRKVTLPAKIARFKTLSGQYRDMRRDWHELNDKITQKERELKDLKTARNALGYRSNDLLTIEIEPLKVELRKLGLTDAEIATARSGE